MLTITFDLPEGVLSALRLSPTDARRRSSALVLARRALPVEGGRDGRHEPSRVHRRARIGASPSFRWRPRNCWTRSIVSEAQIVEISPVRLAQPGRNLGDV